MRDEALKKSDKFVEKLLQLLVEAKSLFPTVKVPLALLRQGLTEYKGVIVPLKNVSHRYLYDFYDGNFIDTYIKLFQKIYEEKASCSTEFAFRTLLEMGVEESFILYDSRIDDDEKNTYTLLKTLVDYFSIETGMRALFSGWYKQLFEENKAKIETSLPAGDYSVMTNIFSRLDGPFDEEFTKALVDGRQLCNTIKARVLNKYSQKKIFVLTEGYKRIKSGEAHTLHGNIFLLNYRLTQQSEQNHLFRVYAHLTISGNDMLKRLSDYLGNQSFTDKVSSHLSQFDGFKTKFNEAWQSKD